MRRFIIALLCLFFIPAVCLADRISEERLNQGIAHDDARAYMLIDRAGRDRADSVRLLKDALFCAPDLPAVYFALSGSVFSFTPRGMFDSIDYLIQGVSAYTDNFWWSFNLVFSVLLSLFLSFILAVLIMLALRIPSDVPLVTHDITEGNIHVLSLILLIPLSALSPLLFVAGLLLLLSLYMKATDKAVAYMLLLFLLLTPFVVKGASAVASALTSGKIRAVVQVNQSGGNSYALSALREDGDFPEVFSYALALKRTGNYDKAIALYDRLAQTTGDPRAYVNLGNCYVGLYGFDEARKGNLALAEKYYLKAVSIRPLVTAYYNLSQVSRELLDFAKGNDYFKSALLLDRDAVARSSLLFARNPNRFVADETLSSSDLWRYSLDSGGITSDFGMFAVSPSLVALIALALGAAFLLMSRRLGNKAFRCRKCGKVLCPGCEKRLTWRQMCPQCYGSLVKLDELDVRERVARLLSIYERQGKRRSTMKILSFVLPGAAQVYAGKILGGFLLLWSFLFLLCIPAAGTLLAVTVFGQSLLSYAALLAAVVLYVLSNIFTRRRIARGWL